MGISGNARPSKASSISIDTPVYRAPSTGIFRLIPSSFVPYAELMRLDRPAGFFAFFWHYAIGIAFAACIAERVPTRPELVYGGGYAGVWVVVFRGAVCAWNDNLDQDFDRRVARCRFRPIARGAVSTLQGHAFTLALLVLCAALVFPLPPTAWLHAAAMTAVLAIYPLGKRVTDFPQVVLGFGLALPVFLCCAALGEDPWFQPPRSLAQDPAPLLWGSLCLYAANGLWTVIFDTVYAFQDIRDDIRAGVKSLAIRLGKRARLGLGIMSSVQVMLLTATGYFCHLSWLYFLIGCGGTATSSAIMLFSVDLTDPKSCAWWFGPGSRLVGVSVVSGLLSHYALRQ